MAIIIGNGPTPIVGDAPRFPDTPPGFTPLSLYAYQRMFQYPQDTEFDTLAFNFYTPIQMTRGQFAELMLQLQSRWSDRYDLLAYGVWERTHLEVEVPTEFCIVDESHCFSVPNCIPIPFTDICVPLAGQTFAMMYEYRVWLLAYDWGAAAPCASPCPRAFGLGAALGIVLIILALVFAVVAVYNITTGKISYSQFVDSVRNVLTTPGQNIAIGEAGLSWPMIAFGVTLVAASLILPVVITKATVKVPVGPGEVTLHAEAGAPPIAPVEPRRRR